MNGLEQFRNAIQSAGLIPPDVINRKFQVPR